MTDLLWWLGQNTIVVALLIPFVWLACRLLPNRPAVQHLLWVVVLLKLITPPLIVWPWSIGNVQGVVVESPSNTPSPVMAMDAPSLEAKPLSSAETIAIPPTSPNASATQWNVPVVQWSIWGLGAVWLGGSLFTLITQLRTIRRHAKLIRSGNKPPVVLQELVDGTARSFGMRSPRIMCISGISSPMVSCLGRVTVLWPEPLSSPQDCQRMQGVIAHELAHLRRCDHWIAWLDLAARIVWWWNPLYWFVSFRVRESAEMACDAMAIASGDHRRGDYAKLLLELSTRFQTATPAPFLGVGTSNASSFERRLAMILSDRVSGGRPLWGMLVAIALAMSALPAWSWAQQKETDASVEEGEKGEAAKRDDVKEPNDDTKASREEDKTLTISANIVDDRGQPIAKAQIWWESTRRRLPPLPAISDEAGRFSVSVPEEEPWGTLWIFKEDKQLAVVRVGRKYGESGIALRQLQRSGEGPNNVVDNELPEAVIQLEPSIDKGYQVLAPDGSPAMGVEVEPWGYRSALTMIDRIPDPLRALLTMKTDQEGRVRFPNLTPVWFDSLEIRTESLGVQVQDGLNDERVKQLLVGETLPLRNTGRIEGQLEAANPEWTRGATLSFRTSFLGKALGGRARVTTDEHGRFVVPAIASGKLWIDCKLAKDVPALPKFPVDQTVTVVEGETVQLSIKLKPSVVVRGIVRTQDTKMPVPGAEVSMGFGNRQYAHAISDAEGRYEARVLLGKISNMQVTYRPPEFRHFKVWRGASEKEVIVDDYEAPFELPPIELIPLVRIAGRLLDEESLPVADTVVRGIQKNRQGLDDARTNKVGEFELWIPKDVSLEDVSLTLRSVTHHQRPTLEPGDPIVLRTRKLPTDIRKSLNRILQPK